MTRRRSATLAAVGVTVVALALLVPSMSGKGLEMDEGSVVAYASRVLDGAVPHRDFLTFYGPGNPVLVAGAFAVFDESVATERAVGLFYRLMIVLSLFALALRLGGVVAAALAGVVSAWMMSNEIVWAYATYGSIAFGLLGLLLAAMGADMATRRAGLLYSVSGLACGAAILMRFDFAPGVLASAVPMLTLVAWRVRAWWGAGLLASAGLYLPHLLAVGWDRLERLVGDLAASGPARRFPIPGLDDELGRLLAAGVVTSIGYVALGLILWRRGAHDVNSRLITSVGLFCCGLVPWALFRADGLHVGPFAVVPLSLLPAVMLLLVVRSERVGARVRAAAPVAVAIVALLPLVDDVDSKLGPARDLRGIRTAYRGFYDDDSRAAAVVVERVAMLARPGDSLFVGSKDLRRADYGPTYMYFLLRDLEPASYYMEMNPGTANREGSGLADELRRADWLILTSEYDPRADSSPLGPSQPNEVVRDLFCPRLDIDEYALYERCPASG